MACQGSTHSSAAGKSTLTPQKPGGWTSFRHFFLCGRPICGLILRRTRFGPADRKSTRLNSSHQIISYAVFCLKKKKKEESKTYIEVEVSNQDVLYGVIVDHVT